MNQSFNLLFFRFITLIFLFISIMPSNELFAQPSSNSSLFTKRKVNQELSNLILVCTDQQETQQDNSMKGKLWLTVDLGPGYMSASSEDESGDEYNVNGVSVAGNFSIGAYLTDATVLYANFNAHTIPEPYFKMGDTEYTSDLISTYWQSVGVGIGRYITDAGILFKGVLGLSSLSLEKDEETIGETKQGLFGCLGLSKSWPISEKVALGITINGHLARMKDPEVDGYSFVWNASGFGVTAILTWVPKGI